MLISFIIYYRATGTLRNQLLFKDTTVLQMCEEGGNHDNHLKNSSELFL